MLEFMFKVLGSTTAWLVFGGMYTLGWAFYLKTREEHYVKLLASNHKYIWRNPKRDGDYVINDVYSSYDFQARDFYFGNSSYRKDRGDAMKHVFALYFVWWIFTGLLVIRAIGRLLYKVFVEWPVPAIMRVIDSGLPKISVKVDKVPEVPEAQGEVQHD